MWQILLSRVAGIIWNINLCRLKRICLSLNRLRKLKRTELLEVAAHYKLSCSSSLKKDEIRRVILERLREEEIISDEDGDELEVSRAI